MSTQSLLELLAKRKQQVSRAKTIQPGSGRNRYRILPGWRTNGDATFYHDFGQHFVKDAAGAVKAVFICTEKTFGQPCQVCDAVAQGMRASQDDHTMKMLEDAKSSGRVLLNVLHIDGPNPTEPQILSVPPSVFNGKKGVGGIISLFDEFPDLLDPQNGNDIIIEKTGAGKEGTSYGVQIAGKSNPVPAEALKRLHDLDKFVQSESEETARRALNSVAAISGLLPPSVQTNSMALPSKDVPAGHVDDFVQLDKNPPAAAPVGVPQPATPPVQAAPAPAAPAAAPAAAPVSQTGDAELDALLADLGPAN